MGGEPWGERGGFVSLAPPVEGREDGEGSGEDGNVGDGDEETEEVDHGGQKEWARR